MSEATTARTLAVVSGAGPADTLALLRRLEDVPGLRIATVSRVGAAPTGPAAAPRPLPVDRMDRWAHPRQPDSGTRLIRYCHSRSIELDQVTARATDSGILYETDGQARDLETSDVYAVRFGDAPGIRAAEAARRTLERGAKSLTVAVERLETGADPRQVVGSITLEREPCETARGLSLKAGHVGRDLLAATLSGTATVEGLPVPGPLTGRPATARKASALRRLARSALSAAFLYCGFVQLRNTIRRRRGTVPGVVVNFHRVADNRPEHWMTIGTAEFERYLAFLERHYRVVSIDEMRRLLGSGRNSEHLLAITFDDGYRECALDAVAALESHGMTAAFFVCSRFVERDDDLAHDRRRGHAGLAKMGPRELQRLSRLGFEIGSHSVDHPDFRHLDEGEIQRQLSESRQALQRVLPDVHGFAVPVGGPAHCRPEVFEAARRSGYRYVLSHFEGGNFPAGAGFHLRRVRAPLDGVLQLHAKIEGWRGLRGLVSRLPRASHLREGGRDETRSAGT